VLQRAPSCQTCTPHTDWSKYAPQDNALPALCNFVLQDILPYLGCSHGCPHDSNVPDIKRQLWVLLMHSFVFELSTHVHRDRAHTAQSAPLHSTTSTNVPMKRIKCRGQVLPNCKPWLTLLSLLTTVDLRYYTTNHTSLLSQPVQGLDPDISLGSANQCILWDVYLRSNLSRNQSKQSTS